MNRIVTFAQNLLRGNPEWSQPPTGGAAGKVELCIQELLVKRRRSAVMLLQGAGLSDPPARRVEQVTNQILTACNYCTTIPEEQALLLRALMVKSFAPGPNRMRAQQELAAEAPNLHVAIRFFLQDDGYSQAMAIMINTPNDEQMASRFQGT
jgi:hypothetical protein